MAHRIFETTTHDYDPVNKYIDEKARLRRTKSTWRNTKALALFLLAFGLFLILAAYAYHIFKKPHPLSEYKTETVNSKNIENELNKEIDEKDNLIEKKNRELQSNPENELLKKEIENLKKEKAEIQKKLENVVYDESVTVFKSKEVGEYTVTTGFAWNKVDDLRFGKEHDSNWCYLESNFTSAKYYFNNEIEQNALLNELRLTKNQAENYKKHCKN
jgi:exonuclease VII large subunit